MKYKKYYFAGLMMLLTSSLQAVETKQPLVSYDRNKDLLSINATEVSQMLLLRRLATQSGLEVLYDKAADRPVSLVLEAVPLMSGLKQLLRGTSHIFHYGKATGDKPMLLGVTVLPSGKEEYADAHPLITKEAEAVIQLRRAEKTSTVGGENQQNWSRERWETRMTELPQEVRAALEQRAKEKLAREKAEKQENAERKAQLKIKAQERVAKRKQQREERLSTMDPERREQLEQRNKQVRKQIYQEIHAE